MAALLTLVGYSVNDTIVVFDRIREVRGKNPELTPQMINDSVNQTLSRTVLTGLSVLLVVLRALHLRRRGRPPVRLRHGRRRDRRHLQLDLRRQPAAADVRRGRRREPGPRAAGRGRGGGGDFVRPPAVRPVTSQAQGSEPLGFPFEPSLPQDTRSISRYHWGKTKRGAKPSAGSGRMGVHLAWPLPKPWQITRNP